MTRIEKRYSTVLISVFGFMGLVSLPNLALATESSDEDSVSAVTTVTAEDFKSVPLWSIGSTQSTLVNNEGSATQTNYLSSYYNRILDENEGDVNWVGTLNALFVDTLGRLREDGNHNRKLDDNENCLQDPVIEFSFATSTGVTFKRSNGNSCNIAGAVHAINDLDPIWSAEQSLSAINPLKQRAYSSIVQTGAAGGRYIFTSIDGTAVGFERGNIDAENYQVFGAENETDAKNIVHFIRGNEIDGFRNRANGSNVLRLGDIVNSKPLAVDKPTGNYDVQYNDTSYIDFKTKYADRRRMVYVGANDGLLHAFNAGFWDVDAQTYELSGGNSEVEHPLGAEVWAYAPEQLLPHLQWLTDPDYPHVYYVDGAPQSFDVNIFPADSVHPNGWGTILVVGMRLGGGPINGVFRSAYIVLDITDPESPPELIAEVSHGDLKYTTSQPALVKKRVPGSGNDWLHASVNEWQLVFGSGPNQLNSVTSDRSTYTLFQYDLTAPSTAPIATTISGSSGHRRYVGALNSTDWNNDYQDDMLYFGTVKSTASATNATGGELMRAVLGSTLDISRLYDAENPLFNQPITARDDQGAYWVYAGTGILFTAADQAADLGENFLAIKEPISGANLTYETVQSSSVVNTVNVTVFEDGSLENAPTIGEDTPSTFTELMIGIGGQSGWMWDLSASEDVPGRRVLTPAVRVGSTLFFTLYTADSGLGSSELAAVHYQTGTASALSILGQDNDVQNQNGADLSQTTIDLGPGTTATPTFILTDDGLSLVAPGSIGVLSVYPLTTTPIIGGRKSWRVLPLQ